MSATTSFPEIKGWPVKRWGYEQAFADAVLMTFERTGDWGITEHKWAELFGRSMDNKVTYEFKSDNWDSPFYITFHDYKVYVGVSIRAYGSNPLMNGEVPK